jgi:hypothetical protein
VVSITVSPSEISDMKPNCEMRFSRRREERIHRVVWSVDSHLSEKHNVSLIGAGDGDFFRNVGIYRPDYTTPKPRIISWNITDCPWP